MAATPGLVVFDCDGVLLDSNLMKVELLVAAAEQHGASSELASRFDAYVRRSFGTSRFRMYEQLLEWDPELAQQTTVDELATTYAASVVPGYLACDEALGASAALGALEDLRLAVVSGSAQEELRGVFAERGLSEHFAHVLGSPVRKQDNLAWLLSSGFDSPVDPADALFLGDARADLEAAEAVGVPFVFVSRYSTDRDAMHQLTTERGWPTIEDLRSLPALLGLGDDAAR